MPPKKITVASKIAKTINDAEIISSKQIPESILKSTPESSSEPQLKMIKIKATITRNGLFVDTDQFTDKSIIGDIKKHFTLSITSPLKFTTYQSLVLQYTINDKKYLLLPVHGGIEYFSSKKAKKLGIDGAEITYNVHRTSTSSPLNLKRKGSPTYNQKLVADHIMNTYFTDDCVKKGRSRLIVNLNTGLGKSYLAAEMISRLNLRTLIVVPNSAILGDWTTKVLRSEFNEKDVGYYYSKGKKMANIVVAVINSLVDQEKSFTFPQGKGKDPLVISHNDFFKMFDFVVIDETQCYCSKEFKKIFWKVAPYTMGLSATPTEADFYKLSEWGIGSIMEASKLKGYEHKDANFKGHVKVIRYTGHSAYTKTIITESTGISSPSKTLNLIVQDPYRAQLAVSEILKLANDHFVFVFSDRRSLNEEIARILRERNDKLKVAVLMGGEGKENVEEAEKNANVIISTYQYMSTGKSIPKMTSLVLLTPRRRKIHQINGRITRLGSDESIVRKTIDIVDYKTIFRGQSSVRNKSYLDRSYEIEVEDVHYSSLEKIKGFKIKTAEDAQNDDIDSDEEYDDNEEQTEKKISTKMNECQDYLDIIDEQFEKMMDELNGEE
jgi:superfamily II DNA or RNA helicase